MTEYLTYRDTISTLVPWWLQGFWGSRLLYSIGVHADALTAWAQLALKARFPSVEYPSSLPALGRDRRVVRGPLETNEGYVARLLEWRQSLASKGGPYALMDQVAGLLAPHAVRMRVVNHTGAWFTREASGAISYAETPWNWDGSPAWARFWLILYPPTSLWVSDGTFASPGTWADTGGTYGSTATYAEALTVRQIVAEWSKPWRCQNVILSFAASEFNPASTPPPAPGPNGTWQLWGNRSPTCVYWDGA